jgi:DNA-binding transcriptional LysR family regulator
MLSSSFTLDQIKTFYTIVQTGSFQRAADILYVSQPTVSAQIKKLECYLDTQLFYRNRKSIRLTKNGARLYKYTIVMMNTCNNLLLDLTKIRIKTKTILNISINENLETLYILPILKLFQMHYPQVKIMVTECNHDQLRVNLSKKHNNISFSNCKKNLLDLQSKLNIEKIMQEKFLFLVPESYKEDKLTIKKLKVLPFLKLKQNEQRVSLFLRKNKLDTLKLDMKLEFSSIAEIYQSVKLKIGVAFIKNPRLTSL